MKRDTIVTKVRKVAEKADVSNIDFLAVQINFISLPQKVIRCQKYHCRSQTN